MLINSETEVDYTPFKALIFYKKDNSRFNEHYYIECANINDGFLQSQRPLSEHELAELLKNVKSQKSKQTNYYLNFTDKNIIQNSVLDGKLKLTWIVKAHENNFIFGRGKKILNKLNYPNLIFQVDGNKLKIMCFKIYKGLETEIFKAPFPNVYNDNSMCFGNINVNTLFDKDIQKTILNFENAFFNSGFNALESAHRTKSNTFELLKRLMNTNEKFPTKELVSTKKKLKNVIS